MNAAEKQPVHEPYRCVCTTRLAFLQALAGWIAMSPPGQDIHAEADGTISVIQQLVKVSEGSNG
jgi:hypothetical protein